MNKLIPKRHLKPENLIISLQIHSTYINNTHAEIKIIQLIQQKMEKLSMNAVGDSVSKQLHYTTYIRIKVLL